MEAAPRSLWLLLALVVVPLSGCFGGSEDDGSTDPTPTKVTQSPATPSGQSPAAERVAFERILDGLQNPLYVTHAGDGSGRIFIVEQPGRIRVFQNGALLSTPFLDLTDVVLPGGERGLLSVAFYPDFKTSGRFVVDYTRRGSGGEAGDTVVARYRATPPSSSVADPSSAEVLLVQDQPQANHNGGLVKFGPDGMLYIAFGDGGGRDDCCVASGHAPEGNGQNLQTWLGKILRVNVSGPGAYRIPPDNPSLGTGSRPEIWAYGLRNPWRFSFDRVAGDMYIGDVGQDMWEEVNVQPRASRGGENYGWPVWEGSHLKGTGPASSGVGDYTFPVAEYSIFGTTQECSITGGYVYRGAAIPELRGRYVVGDYCSGQVWTLDRAGSQWTLSPLADTSYSISSFGEDEAGELYLTDHQGGAVFKLSRK